MNNFEIDSLSRKKIVSQINTNFFVEAGAGSGKTTMLVNRMVAMVEEGIDIGKISAITFTKAAAGEFYDRFQKKLIERSNPALVGYVPEESRPGDLKPLTEEGRERCEKALQNIDLCFMGTIDSFCNMILSEHPFDAQIPSDSTIISDDELKVILSRIFVLISEEKLGLDAEKQQKLKKKYDNFCKLHRDPKEVFLAAMPVLLGHRNAEIHYAKDVAMVDFDTRFAAEKNFLAKLAAAYLKNNNVIKAKYGNEGKYGYRKFSRTFYSLFRSWNENFPLVYDAIDGLLNTQIQVTPARIGEGAEQFLNAYSYRGITYYLLNLNRSGGMCEKLDDIRYNISMDFLMDCIPLVEAYKKEKGLLTYFDYLYYLRNMLKKDAEEGGELIAYIKNRHSYFLIDEFQDTDPMQAEIFFYLSAEKPVADWRKCVPSPGSIFIVGDPKQSIYRFRSADVTSFLNVKKLFTDEVGEVLALPCNFRSTKTLIEYYNGVFSDLLPEETVNQSKFEEIPVPVEKNMGLTGIYKYDTVSGKYASDYPTERDDLRIGQIIMTLVGNPEYKIVTPDMKEPHEIRFKDIMLITYSKRYLTELMPYLNSIGIPTKVEGKVLFEENEALIEICKIYRYASDLLNRKALYGALTGKIINLSFEDLLKYRKKGGTLSFFIPEELKASEDEEIKKVVDKIGELNVLQKKALTLSPAALFSEIMEQFRVYEAVNCDHLEVLYYTLELLKNAEKSGVVVSHKDALNYLEMLLSGTSEEERCLSVKDDLDCVHMANLHKLKGLEAPVVILSYSGLYSKTADLRIEHGTEKTEGWIFNISSEMNEAFIKTTYFNTTLFAQAEQLEAEALAAEDDRLIYVAATRARNVLIINNNRFYMKGDPVYNSRWKPVIQTSTPDFFTCGEFGIRNSFTGGTGNNGYEDATALYDKAKEACVLGCRDAEEETYVTVNPSRITLSSKMDDEQVTIGLDTGVVSGSAASKVGSGIEIAGNENEATSETDGRNAGNEYAGVPGADARNENLEAAAENGNAGEKVIKKTEKDMRYAALTGTVVHRYMEKLVESRDLIVTEETIEEILREFSTPVNAEYEEKMREILTKVAETIHTGGYVQTDGTDSDILGILMSADEVYCEAPFGYMVAEDGKDLVTNGIMDVVYRDASGWHIVDYKTNLEDEGLEKKYKGQLDAYVHAFQEITGQTADARIYHIEV